MALGRDLARADAAARDNRADTADGQCVGVDILGGFASVNIGGAVQVMKWDGTPPWNGDRVRVTYAGKVPTCRAVYGASQGTVVAVNANVATVTGDDGVVYVYPVEASVSAISGTRVRLDHGGHLVVGAYRGEPPAASYVPQAPPPALTVQDRWFYPTESGNYRSGSFTPGPAEVSDNRTGVYWYGSQIADSIPDAATILTATVSLSENWDNISGTASHLGTHTQTSRGGTPTISGAIDVTGGGTVDISAYANALKTGAAYGLGFAPGFGWRQFGSAASSGGIHIIWQ